MGWESTRYWVEEDGGYASSEPPPIGVGLFMQAQGTIEDHGRQQQASETVADGLVMEVIEQSINDNANGRYSGLLSETAVSGYRRWCGRGGHVFRHLDAGLTTTRSYDRDMKNNVRLVGAHGSPNPTTWSTTYINVDAVANNTRFNGYVHTPSLHSSSVSDNNFNSNGFYVRAEMFGYNFGVPQFFRRTAGSSNP